MEVHHPLRPAQIRMPAEQVPMRGGQLSDSRRSSERGKQNVFSWVIPSHWSS